jgi:hypothetical protein
MDVGGERTDDSGPVGVEGLVECAGDLYIPWRVRDLHGYDRGTSDLHVPRARGEAEFGAILEYARVGRGPGVAGSDVLVPCRILPQEAEAPEGRKQDGQALVSVSVRDSVEE